MIGEPHRGKETRIERTKSSIAQRSLQKGLISGLPQPLGKVLVSSGKHSQSGIKRVSTRLGSCGTGRALDGTRNRSFFGCRAVS
jgi:hypothetical protein